MGQLGDMAEPNLRLDFIVFGATGFTAKYVMIEILNINKTEERVTWGVAGRNEERLKKALKTVSDEVGVDLKDIPIFISDAIDEESLNEMAVKAKVVLNCCGPYRFFGEPVVKACVSNGAHHVDISGEPQYMEEVQLKYHDQAIENGVYVVSACGFDSVPTDLGIIFLEKEFKGQVNSVETYLESEVSQDVQQNSAFIHYTTWESAVHGFANAKELGPLRRKLYPQRLPPLNPRLPSRSVLHKSDVVNKWCLPFPGSDRAVVQRSQRFLLEMEKKRPVQVYTYVAFQSILSVLMVGLVGIAFSIFASFKLGRSLLLKYPRFFSVGTISHEGPSKELAEATQFKITIVGQGWSEKQAEPLDNPQTLPDKTLVVQVKGRNPGYAATATFLVRSALTILRESASMPGKGGVLPPGVAFARTSILEAFQKSSTVHFEVLEGKTVKTDKFWHSYIGEWVQDLVNRGIY